MVSEDIIKEIQRKIGRNVLLFQQLEHLLKFIVANGKVSGFASELKDKLAERASTINKQTMGQVVGQFIENSNPNIEEFSQEPLELKEAYISFSFHIEGDSVYYEEKKERFARIVSERNELIHHLLPRLDTNSLKSCKAIEEQLDGQAERLRGEINSIRSIAKALQDGRKELAEYLGSDVGKKEFLLSLRRQNRLVILLGEIANQVAREDGWTSMNIAGQLLKQHAPEELALFRKVNEYKSLKALMVAAELFDFLEEQTPKGGVRVLYKLKDGWKLSYT